VPPSNLNNRVILLTEHLRLSGPVKVADVLDIVAMADGDAARVEQTLRELFAWHHARGIAGMQIAFAPAVVAALALASRGASLALVLVATGLLVAGIAAGVWRVSELHRFDRQVVLALMLAKAVAGRQSELWAVCRRSLLSTRLDAASQDAAAGLYEGAGHLTLAECVAEESARATLAGALRRAGID
jgi:hypothetical protein